MKTTKINGARSNKTAQLTEREELVLQRMAEGQARKQIAAGLEMNSHTLDYVIRCAYRKLNVNSLGAAVSVAVRKKILKF